MGYTTTFDGTFHSNKRLFDSEVIYIINNFIEYWGYALDGEVNWQGERARDRGTIAVNNNQIILPEGAQELLRYAVSPVSVPQMVWDFLAAV